MNSNPVRHRINFSEVTLGQRFYDPVSAEYFVKLNDTMAAMVTGIGDGTVPDEFEPDDVVGIDQTLTVQSPEAESKRPSLCQSRS